MMVVEESGKNIRDSLGKRQVLQLIPRKESGVVEEAWVTVPRRLLALSSCMTVGLSLSQRCPKARIRCDWLRHE